MAFSTRTIELSFTDTLPFGKYKNVTIAEVAKCNHQYLHWLHNNTKTKIAREVLNIDPKTALKYLPKAEVLEQPQKLSEKEFLKLVTWNTIKNIYGDPTDKDF